MQEKSAHLQVISQQSTKNAANLPLQTCEEYQRTIFPCMTRVTTLAPAINLLCKKFSFCSSNNSLPFALRICTGQTFFVQIAE